VNIYITTKDIRTLSWRPMGSTSPLTDILVSEFELELLKNLKKTEELIINLKLQGEKL
jgi:hypothetical protein